MWKYGVLQITILTLVYYNFGFIYGTIFTLALYKVAEAVFQALGYAPINIADIGMGFEEGDCTNNLVSYFEVGKIDIDSVKKRVYQKGISKIEHLRYIRSDILGLALFKIGSEEEAMMQTIRTTKECKNDQEIIDYCSELAVKKLDHSKPLWEIHVQEDYQKDKSLVFFVFQHSILDAVGFASLVSALLDNQFTIRMKKKFTPITWQWKIIYLMFGPLYTAIWSARFKMFSSDKQAAKLTEKNNYNTHQKN